MIKRVEVNYRGIFQKNLGKKIGSDIVMIASRMGQKAFSNGRYSDSPERNGIPCKYFAFVSPDLAEEELEAECGAKLEIDEANISVVLDDTMCKGVEPWGWHGVRPINERVVKDGCLLVVSNKKPEELLKWFEMAEGAVVPAVKRGFEMGPKGQSRNAMFKRGTTKTQRPAVRFDLCTKCTLCWVECPDECFDPTTDGLYDIEYQYCVGCGKCAEVCPVQECIVMVDELQFEDDSSPWEHWKKDSKEYIQWVEGKKGKDRVSYPVVTGKGITVTKGEVMPEGKIIPVRKTEEVEA